jgi:acetyltransferase-like isoleucine patch superfamily enzyme
MGDRVAFNYGCYVNGYGGLVIGDRSIFGPYTMIHTANHEMDLGSPIPDQGWIPGRVAVGRDCWIGMGVSILPGVTIGEGCVIGAGSVVAKDVPDFAVAVGNPATPIRDRRGGRA